MTEDKDSSKQPDQPTNGKDNKPQMKWSEWFPRESESAHFLLEIISSKRTNEGEPKADKK